MMNLDDHKLNRLYQYACSLTHNDEQAYDLVHDALIKARRFIVFNQEAYLKKCIRNQYYDEYKKNKKTQQLEEIDSISQVSFEDLIVDQDQLKDILSKLNDDERELLYLALVEEYSYKEISQLLEIKIGTVMSRLNRIKEKLRRYNEK